MAPTRHALLDPGRTTETVAFLLSTDLWTQVKYLYTVESMSTAYKLHNTRQTKQQTTAIHNTITSSMVLLPNWASLRPCPMSGKKI